MSIKLQLPKLTDLRPRLTVIGVGGAGCNAVNNMIAAGLTGVDFVVANTDAQALAASSAEHKVQLGINLTEGLGAGARPEVGEAAAEEAIEELRAQITGSHMVFVAAGMGGGTGTGAAAVIARCAKELGILTVGVVTKPFQFEGARRMRIAEAGIVELKKYVDTLIVIPNQNLFRIASEKTTFAEAFILADQVLYSGVACIVDLIIKEGLINLDFADVRTIMSGMGTAMMGTGEATGEQRAIMAAEEAISNPLLDDVSLKGARGLLLSITGGSNLTLYEVDEAATRVRQEVDPEANIIVGATYDENLGDRVRVSIVASGMARSGEPARAPAMGDAWPRGAKRVLAPGAPFDTNAAHHTGGTNPAPAPSPIGAPAPASARPGEDDHHRRLSDALSREGPASGPAPTAVPPPFQQMEAPPYTAPHAREPWRGPGNVTIEAGLPHLRSNPMPRRTSDGATQQADGPFGFTPAPPVDMPRTQRRFPAVEDFPPVAQREYRAKSACGSDAAAPGYARNEPRRRFGFLDRLTGRHRRDGDSLESEADRATLPQLRGTHDRAHDRDTPSQAEDDSRRQRASVQVQEEPDLPVFFTRGRK
jgi:cell division protein FtsZ